MNWCVECYAENRQTPATKMLDGDDLCDRHYALAAEVGGKDEVSTMEEKICGREGCGKALASVNKSGFCAKHFYYSKRNTEPKSRGRKPNPVLNVRAEIPQAIKAAPPALPQFQQTVTVSVTANSLDLIWNRLDLQEKASLLFPAVEQ